MLEKIKTIFGWSKTNASVREEDKQVGFVREGKNSWRVVYKE